MKKYIETLFEKDIERLEKVLHSQKLSLKTATFPNLTNSFIQTTEAELFWARTMQKKIIRLIVAAEGKP